MPTVKELQAEARSRNITGYSSLRKAELLSLLQESPRRSPKRVPKRKSPKRKSPKRVPRKSPKRGSPKRVPRKSPKRGSPKRGSPKRGSPKRGSPTLLDNIKGVEWYVFTMSGCGYCTKANKLLLEHNQHFMTYEVTKYNQKSVYDVIDSLTDKYRYFPVVFNKGKFIGGYQELSNMLI